MIKVPQLNHEINMKNGTLIQGSIVQENLDKLIIQTQIGQLTIDKGNVDSINEIAPSNAKVEFNGDAEEKIMSECRISMKYSRWRCAPAQCSIPGHLR